jgi:hypothetical protein
MGCEGTGNREEEGTGNREPALTLWHGFLAPVSVGGLWLRCGDLESNRELDHDLRRNDGVGSGIKILMAQDSHVLA